MNSGVINDKISEKIGEKQCFYLIVLELFGVFTLFLPEMLSRKLNQDAPLGLVLGFVFAGIFAGLLNLFNKYCGKDFLNMDKKNKFLMDVITFLFFVQTLLLSVVGLNMTWEIVKEFLLPDLNKFLIILPFFGICIYALGKNIASRARMAEFFGRIFMFLLIFIFISSIGKIDLNQYEAIFIEPTEKILISGYEVFILLETIVFTLFASKAAKKETKYGRYLKFSLLTVFITTFVLLLILIGTFGVRYIGNMEYPVIRLLRNLLTGSFLNRIDIALITIWIVSLFYFVCGGMNYSHMLLQSVLEDSSGKYMDYVLYGIVFVLSWIFGNVTNSYYIYRNYMFYVGSPAAVILLVILVTAAKFSANSKGKREALNEK